MSERLSYEDRAEDKLNLDPSEEDVQTPIDPNEAEEALKEVNAAKAIRENG